MILITSCHINKETLLYKIVSNWTIFLSKKVKSFYSNLEYIVHSRKARIPKNTMCGFTGNYLPSFIAMNLDAIYFTFRSKDTHLFDFPMIVNMKFIHNHPIICADVLRHLNFHLRLQASEGEVPKNVWGWSLSALDMDKLDVQIDDQDDEFVFDMADRALVPNVQWCYR